MDVLELSNQYQKTAEKFLAHSKFISTLSQFGRVEFEGAYAGKVMLHGDIDIRVVRQESFSFTDSLKIVGAVNTACVDDFRSYYVKGDWQDARFGNQFPHGKYLGFKFQLNNENWKCDLWLLSEVEHERVRATLDIGKLNLTEEQRKLILECKLLRQTAGLRLSGQEIYEAVIQNGLINPRDLLKEQ